MGIYLRTIWELAEYFNTLKTPMIASEMMDFWCSLSDEERVYYLTAPLD